MNRLISFCVEPDLFTSLQSLAGFTHDQYSYHLNRALAQYLEQQKVQIGLIHEGLADAEAGNLVSLDDIENKWGHGSC